jgi:hypothetical protein
MAMQRLSRAATAVLFLLIRVVSASDWRTGRGSYYGNDA